MEGHVQPRPVTLVWIDAREALIVRWSDDVARLERLESDVPRHRKSAGHVRHNPAIRPGGGGGAPATAGDPRRIEHLTRFLETVAERLPDDDLELIGPGSVHEQLAQAVRERDPRGSRHIETAASGPLTERQLVARLRSIAGHAPRRRTVPA